MGTRPERSSVLGCVLGCPPTAPMAAQVVVRVDKELGTARSETWGVVAWWGSLSPVTPATNSRYVGSFTDSGHTAGDPAFGVIQDTHELNLGKIEDFFSESLRLQYQWALRLANSYYTQPAARNYWDGCSTGGRQGLVLAAKHGNDFDGFLIGAPHTNHSRTSSAGSWRAWVNQEIAGGTVTPQKLTAAVNRMIAECDGQDGVVDGILSEPRACKASAALNICGMPGAPTDGSCRIRRRHRRSTWSSTARATTSDTRSFFRTTARQRQGWVRRSHRYGR